MRFLKKFNRIKPRVVASNSTRQRHLARAAPPPVRGSAAATVWLAAGLVVLVAIGACSTAAPALRVQSARIENDMLSARLAWQPDAVVLDALDHGIALQFAVSIEAQAAATLGWHAALARSERHLELRYFPLSRQYRWRDLDSGDTRNYSARSLLLGALEDLRLPLSAQFRSAPATRYRLRIELERDALPGALRLPALLDPKWHVSSGDYTWPATGTS